MTQPTIEEVLGMLNGHKAEEVKDPQDAVLEEVHRYHREQLDAVYERAMANVESKLEYAGTKYLAAGFFGAIFDGILAFPTLKTVLNAPAAKQLLHQRFGEENIYDAMACTSARKKGTSITEERKSVGKLEELMTLVERRLEAVAEYAHQTGKSVYDILRNPEDQVAVIVRTYGSFEKYEEQHLASLKASAEQLQKMDSVQSMPLAAMMQSVCQLKGYALEDRALNEAFAAVAPGIEKYAKELTMVARELYREYIRRGVEEFQKYKVIMQVVAKA